MSNTSADTVDAVPETPQESPARKFSRDQIREAILNAPDESEVIDVFGVQVEIRAPDLEGLLQYRDAEKDDFALARAITGNCYVPGTQELVFEPADVEALMKVKYSKDMQRLTKTINRVLGAEGLDKEVNDHTKSPEA